MTATIQIYNNKNSSGTMILERLVYFESLSSINIHYKKLSEKRRVILRHQSFSI